MRIFVRREPERPFAGYLLEILAVEGFLGFDTFDLTGRELSPDLLDGQEQVLVAAMTLDSGEQAGLEDYVRAGGRLIALRPPVTMAPLFGLEATGTVLTRGHYLQFDEERCPDGAYSTDIPLHVHADADRYQVKDAEAVAWFCWGNGARRHYPAASIHSGGRGTAAMLAFDLAHSTVLLHQGLPEQASTGSRPDPGGLGQFKPDAHFIGHLDVTHATIPQADLQGRLLSALIEALLPAPVPRLWYFPHAEPCLAFLNGDSDSMDQDDLDGVLAIIEPRGGHYTCYVMDEEPLSPQLEADLRARGHSFGKHVWTAQRPTLEEMAAAVETQIAGFRRRYGYTPLTNRGHCLIWPGWTEMARFLSAAGVRMDSNFVACHCGHGYLTGSGLPVKFMDERGHLIDLYEQSTQWEDDVALAEYFARLSYQEAVAHSLVSLDEARRRYHTVVNFNFHPIHIRPQMLDTGAWITAVAQHCKEQGTRMIGGDEWARFNDARRLVTMSGFTADPARRQIGFRLTALAAADGLTVTLPAAWAGAPFRQAEAGGTILPHRPARIHEEERIFLPLSLTASESRAVVVTYSP